MPLYVLRWAAQILFAVGFDGRLRKTVPRRTVPKRDYRVNLFNELRVNVVLIWRSGC
jgi:hypothetical protein